MPLTLLRTHWAAGERFAESFEGRQFRQADSVVNAVQSQLKRRLGGAFSTVELCDLYRSDLSWAETIIYASNVDFAELLDLRLIDAAFHRYSRFARDWPSPSYNSGDE